MRTVRSTRKLAAVMLAGALALTACGGQDEQAETATELSEEDRLAALESELAQLREDGDTPDDQDSGDPDANDGEDGDEDGAESNTEDTDRASTDGGDTVEPRVFEVGETRTNDRDDLEVTIERIVVRDYHIEVELTAFNDHPENTRNLWSGSSHRAPLLFDEQDRRFEYQHPAGYQGVDPVAVGPGQRLDAVMMFGRRLHPDAEVLTLRFRHGAIEDWEWTVDLAETER